VCKNKIQFNSIYLLHKTCDIFIANKIYKIQYSHRTFKYITIISIYHFNTGTVYQHLLSKAQKLFTVAHYLTKLSAKIGKYLFIVDIGSHFCYFLIYHNLKHWPILYADSVQSILVMFFLIHIKM
jgi:hypothetical protein